VKSLLIIILTIVSLKIVRTFNSCNFNPMRNLLFIICFLLFSQPALHAQKAGVIIIDTGRLTIGNTQFTYSKARLPEADSAIAFNLYAHGKKLLMHSMVDEENDCNSTSLELGDYTITGATITFYSYWAWVGGCCGLPYGARKQVYTVNAKRQLHLSSSQIFLEEYKNRLADMPGKDATQFMAKVEKQYHAKFVTGAEADDLIYQVKQRFVQQIAKTTKGWEKNRFGFRR
jgi:hypothetical protein